MGGFWGEKGGGGREGLRWGVEEAVAVGVDVEVAEGGHPEWFHGGGVEGGEVECWVVVLVMYFGRNTYAGAVESSK